MNIIFDTVSFVTYEGPVELTPEKKKRQKIISALFPIIALSCIALLIFGLGELEGLLEMFFSQRTCFIISILLVFVLVICFVVFQFYGIKKVKAEFKPNGKLIIDNTGFHIEQIEVLFIKYEDIEQIEFQRDRLDPSFGHAYAWSIKTFKVTFQYNNKLKTLFVDRIAEFGFRQAHGDLWETFQALRKTDHSLYQRIKYIE